MVIITITITTIIIIIHLTMPKEGALDLLDIEDLRGEETVVHQGEAGEAIDDVLSVNAYSAAIG